MKTYYQSLERFQNTIIKRWQKRGFKWNASHLAILKYSYHTLMLFASLNGLKVSQTNRKETTLKLF
jgi:hypothetical protein